MIPAEKFDGKDIYQSGYYGKRNTKAMEAGGATSSNAVIIGECKAGVPWNATTDYPDSADRINWVSNTNELNSILRDGKAYYGALFALTPSNQSGVNTPTKVGVVRINKATKGVSVIKDSETADSIDTSSRDYGLYVNQIRRKITTGTLEGKKITIKFEDQTVEGDNVTYSELTVVYSGAGATCILTLDPAAQTLVTITGANGAAAAIITTADTTGIVPGMVLYAGGTADITGPIVGVVQSIVANTSITINQNLTNLNSAKTYFFKSGALTMTSPAAPADNKLIDLGDFDTVANLVAYMQSFTNYSAVLTGSGESLVTTLDSILVADAVNIKTPAIYTVRATQQAIIDWFNDNSVYLNAVRHATAPNRIPVNDTDYVFLTGGTEGAAPIQQDWQDAMDNILATNDISLCTVMTSDAAVQAALSAHVTYMSGVQGRNERQAVVGCGLSDAKATKIAAAKALNNLLMSYACTEIKRYDKNGTLTTWDGYYLGALLMGLSAGNDVTFSWTNKQLNIIGVKEKYSSPTKDDYIKNGCVIVAPSDSGGLRVSRSVTTYQAANKIDNEFSAVRTSLFIVKDHRAYVESLVGEPGDDTALETIKNRAESRIDTYVERNYLVVDPQYGNAYRNFTFSVVADTVNISYEGTLVLPVNFIFVQHNFVVIGVKK